MSETIWYDHSADLEAQLNRNRMYSGDYRYVCVRADGVPGIVRIVRTPDTCAGHPRIDGTRMTVHDLVSNVKLYKDDGLPLHRAIGEVANDFPDYPPHIIHAVWQWYEWHDGHKAEIETILDERRRDYERGIADGWLRTRRVR